MDQVTVTVTPWNQADSFSVPAFGEFDAGFGGFDAGFDAPTFDSAPLVTRKWFMPLVSKSENGHRYVFDSRTNQFVPFDMSNAQNFFKVVIPLVGKYIIPFIRDLKSGMSDGAKDASTAVRKLF